MCVKTKVDRVGEVAFHDNDIILFLMKGRVNLRPDNARNSKTALFLNCGLRFI